MLSGHMKEVFFLSLSSTTFYLLLITLFYLVLAFPTALIAYMRGNIKLARWLTVIPTIIIVLDTLLNNFSLMWLVSMGVLAPLGLL